MAGMATTSLAMTSWVQIMKPEIRRGRTDDAEFIARTILLAQRGPRPLGWFDFALDRPEPEVLAFLERLAVAGQSSWYHVSQFLVAEINAVRLLEIGWSADVREAARKVKCPVLVIHAERDCAVPIAEGRLLASLIPDCRFLQFDSQNHMPLLDEPEWPRLIAEIQSFLAKLAAVTSTRHHLPLEELTNRERSVLECIADGLDNSEIASILGLSEKTVRNHITRVFDKIQVQHRYQAIVRARDGELGTRAARR